MWFKAASHCFLLFQVEPPVSILRRFHGGRYFMVVGFCGKYSFHRLILAIFNITTAPSGRVFYEPIEKVICPTDDEIARVEDFVKTEKLDGSRIDG